jgi:hypothetical protein
LWLGCRNLPLRDLVWRPQRAIVQKIT